MADISSLKESVDAAMSRPGTVCLWFSGGSDSRLLLELMLKTGKPFGILLFQDGWTREQKRKTDEIIIKHNLMTFSYPAIENLLVAENGEISLVSAYAIDSRGNTFPVIRDLVDEPKRCLFDVKLDLPQMRVAPTAFDTHILGTRSDDRHWIFGDKELGLGEEWLIGEAAFITPLWNWAKDEVAKCLIDLGIEDDGVDTGNIECCSNCLTQEKPFCPKAGEVIEPHQWDAEGNLKVARKWLIGDEDA